MDTQIVPCFDPPLPLEMDSTLSCYLSPRPLPFRRSQSTVATTPAVKPVDMQGMMDREDRESKKQRLQSAIVVDPPRLVPKLAKTPPQVFEGDARMTWMERAERPASWTGAPAACSEAARRAHLIRRTIFAWYCGLSVWLCPHDHEQLFHDHGMECESPS